MDDNKAFVWIVLMIAITIIVVTHIATNYNYELEVKDNHLIQTGKMYKSCMLRCESAIRDFNQAETLECLKHCSSKAKCIIEEI